MTGSGAKKIRITVLNKETGEFAWKTLLLLAICYLSWFLIVAAHLGGFVPLWLGTLALTATFYVIFTPMHEAAHLNISGRQKKLRWVDFAAGSLASFGLFVPFVGFERLHYHHHQNTNVPGKDPDLWVNGRNFFDIVFRCFTIFPKQMYFFMTKPIATKQQKLICAAFIILKFSIAGYWMFAGYLSEVIFLWLLPAWFALALLAYCFDYLPHVPFVETKIFHNTRNVGKPYLNYVFLYQNYHQIHHLNPRVPFYRYYLSYKRVKPLLDEKAAEVS